MEASREAGTDDVARIAELARLLHEELAPSRGGALWAQRERRPEPLDAYYLALLDRPDVRLVVGTIGGAVIGFAAVELERLRNGRLLGRVTDLFVEPEARSVGVGEAMVGRLLEFCARHECVGVDAFVLPGHRAAKNFFEESGFTARAIVMHRPAERD